MDIRFEPGALTVAEQAVVLEGFRAHSAEQGAPDYAKERFKWLGIGERGRIEAVLTAEIVWDWVYIDELWVSAESRGTGLGRRLIELLEEFATSQSLQGIWLWTQTWQAVGFYSRLGYEEFARFDDFPRGHARVGFRKRLKPNPDASQGRPSRVSV